MVTFRASAFVAIGFPITDSGGQRHFTRASNRCMVTALGAVTAIITRENQRRSWTRFLNKVKALLTLQQVLLPTYSVQNLASAVASLSHAYVMIWYCGSYRHRRIACIRLCRNQVAECYLPCVFASASCSLHTIGLLCIRVRGSCAQSVYQCLRLFSFVLDASLDQDVIICMCLYISSLGYRGCNE